MEEYVSFPISMFGKEEFYNLRARGDFLADIGIKEMIVACWGVTDKCNNTKYTANEIWLKI